MKDINFKHGYFIPKLGLELVLNRGGYFNSRYSINFCFAWGILNIKLPFRASIDEACSSIVNDKVLELLNNALVEGINR